MIYWQGKRYELIQLPYNGEVAGYLLDGFLRRQRPKSTLVRGHILTDEGVIVILRRDIRLPLCLLAGVLLLAAVVLWPRYTVEYYQATFAEKPVLAEGVLYCNVLNESDCVITVQFLNDSNKSMIHTLEPGDALPYLHIDFVPTIIRYNESHNFQLEVQSD